MQSFGLPQPMVLVPSGLVLVVAALLFILLSTAGDPVIAQDDTPG